jgi:prepilin-type processing-associated H-X9-DG protein
MRFLPFSSTVATLLIVVSSARAAQQPDNAVAPFVGPYTLAVLRGDIDRVDENALADLLINTVKEPGLGKPQRDMLRGWWKSWSNIGEGPLSDYRDAGVTRVYWVLELQDCRDLSPSSGVWVFPIEGKADAQKLIDVSHRHKLEARQVGKAVVASQPGREAPAGSAAALPADWAHALGAGGDAPIRAAIVPTETLRKSFEENLPNLPAPAGPVPITTLTRGIEWVSVSATLAPNPQIRMIAQTTGDQAAQAIAGVLDRMLADVWGPEPRVPPFFLTPAELAKTLKPTVAGDQLRWEPDFEKVLAPVIARDVRQGVRQHSATNMRQILQGFVMYANGHKGETPPDLNALLKDQDMSPQVLVDPLNPSDKVGFIYIRPMGDWQNKASDWAVLYEKSPTGFNVAFADGHVEWFATRNAVDEQVKTAEARNRSATEGKK